MSFEFKECFSSDGTKIEGLYEIQPKVFGDARGYFFEVYSERDFFEAGLTMKFVQDNQSASTKGVLRGLHFQTQHPQGKLVRAYKCTDFYDPKGEGGLMWNDPVINIDWASVAPGLTPLLSEKDGKHPAFDINAKYFDINAKWIGE